MIIFYIDYIFLYSFTFYHFTLCCTACGILVLQAGIEPVPPALEAQSLNHWTTREVQLSGSLEIQNDQGKSRPHSAAAAHQE